MQLPPTLGHLALLGCPRDRVSEPIPTKCLEAKLGCGFRLGGQLRGLAVLRTWQGWGRGDVRSQSETRVDSPLLPPTHNLTSFNNIVNGVGGWLLVSPTTCLPVGKGDPSFAEDGGSFFPDLQPHPLLHPAEVPQEKLRRGLKCKEEYIA